MSYQKPLVTIELDEYNKMLKYIALLDESIGDNPYKSALENIVREIFLNPQLNYAPMPLLSIRDSIIKYFNDNKLNFNSATFEITINN